MPKPNRRKRSAPGADWHATITQFSMPLAMALIVIATCVIYYPTMQCAFVWNDSDYVTRAELRSMNGLARIWFDVGATQQYYPLLHSFFWIQWQLWGESPLGYHLVNVLLHAGAACLLYQILRKLKIPGALLAAAIFAMHPVMVETVAWVTEQKNTLSTVFYLGALLTYLHFDETRRRWMYFLALGLFVMAVFSKTVTATLPAALLVIIWWQRGSLSWQRDVKPLASWFGLAIAGGLFTSWVERKFIGAEGPAFAIPLAERILIAGRVPWFYLGKLLWPTNLIFMYPRWEMDPTDWRQWLFPLASAGMLIGLWQLRRRWRGPLAAWLLFIGTLVPVLGFLNVYWFLFSFVADHLQYLASLAVIVLAAAGIVLAIGRLPSARWMGKVLCVALLGTLGALTWRQAQMYGDVVTLYQTTINKNPNCWLAYNNLGIEIANAGQNPEAILCFEQALRIRPDYPEAHNNLGLELAAAKRTPEAIEHYERAIELKPDYADAHYNLGRDLFTLGKTEEAIKEYQIVLGYNPDHVKAHNNLGNILRLSGKLPEAFEHYQHAVRVDPGYFEAQYNLGSALVQVGRMQEAIEHFQQALELSPNNIETWVNLMMAYSAIHDSAKAAAAAEKALQLAHAQGQTSLEQEIAAWLAQHRAQMADPPQTVPQSSAARPQSQ